MRILLLDQFAESGGAQRCLVDVADGFVARGWELHAAAPEGPLLERLRPLCRSVAPIPCGPFQAGRKTAADALRMIRQFPAQHRRVGRLLRRVDVVYVNGPRLMPLAALLPGNVPVVFHAHSRVLQGAASALLRTSIRASRAFVIAASHFVAEPLGAGAHVVPNGVCSCARPRRGGQSTVAVLGRISPEKGQLEFVRAVRALNGTIDCRFLVAGAPMFGGDGYFERVRQEADGSGIEFTGWAEDVPDFLAGVDVLVVPSDTTDATPRVIPEAFSAGTGVVAFAAGGIPELVRDGVDGWLVRERSAQALAGGIADALRCPERLRGITERARRRWRNEFTVERFQTDICEAVQAALQRRHQRNPLTSSGAIAEA